MEGIVGAFVERVDGLVRRNGRLYMARPGTTDEVVVTVRFLRPLTDPSEIVFLDEKNQEVATLRGVESLTSEQRPLVDEALRERYHLLEILTVHEVDVRFGTRYWRVETDRGPRWFTLRHLGKNVTWISDRHLTIRDTAGNRYRIRDLTSLDARSRSLVVRSL